MKREVEFKEENDAIGSWTLICPTCPMHVHQKAIGAKLEKCLAGMQTRIQGPVPFHTCKHYQKETIDSSGSAVTLECDFGDRA